MRGFMLRKGSPLRRRWKVSEESCMDDGIESRVFEPLARHRWKGQDAGTGIMQLLLRL